MEEESEGMAMVVLHEEDVHVLPVDHNLTARISDVISNHSIWCTF
jgi:hypothetical protein